MVATIALTIAAVGAALSVAFVLVFRTKFRPALDLIRRMNRAVTNPHMLRTAGQREAPAAVVHHVGRVSGRSYRTPVVAVPAPEGLLIALPYGRGADWVRNVLAAGSATIEHEGRTIPVHGPELVPAGDANPFFPARAQRMHRLFGVDDFLLLRHAEE